MWSVYTPTTIADYYLPLTAGALLWILDRERGIYVLTFFRSWRSSFLLTSSPASKLALHLYTLQKTLGKSLLSEEHFRIMAFGRLQPLKDLGAQLDYNISRSTFGRVFRLHGSGHVRSFPLHEKDIRLFNSSSRRKSVKMLCSSRKSGQD